MLGRISTKKFYVLNQVLALSALFILASCNPTPVQSKLGAGAVEGESPTNSTYPNPTYPLSGTFVQEGAVRTKTNFVIPLDFTDKFLVRGDALSTYLKTIPNTTKFCLAGKFNYISNNDKFLILAAKPKIYVDLIKKTSEYYLLVEPSGSESNLNDCQSYNLTNVLFTNSTNPSAHFSLGDVCAQCTSSATSGALRLYFNNGEEVPNIVVNSLTMTISGSSSGGSVSSCTTDTACKSRDFDCCLQSQCVKDAALKPGVSDILGYDTAVEDVRINPSRYRLYPQFYFVCEGTTGSTSGGSSGGGNSDQTTDPAYEAEVALLELTHLHECTKLMDGEFSYCTVKIPNASDLVPATFPSEGTAFPDDINFSKINSNLGIGDRANNIVRIRYAGKTVYEQNSTPLSGGTLSAPNDCILKNTTDCTRPYQTFNLTQTLPVNAKDGHLYLTYKVDGTCQKIGSTLARCTKSYIQQSSDVNLTTYHDNSPTYLLPSYADTSTGASMIVKVAGITVPDGSSTWRIAQSPNRIIFSDSYRIYQNQTVEITYYVKQNVNALIGFRELAQAKVNSICGGATSSGNWSFTPKYENGRLVSYDCTPPQGTATEAPANQTVLVSGKNVPHRFYDSSGVSYDTEIPVEPPQELNSFSYIGGNLTRPNNISSYVGFNEIYGSFERNSASSARPAKMARVKKDRTYDILVASGSFSSCANCGNDYYSALQKIFPESISGQGGGYSPYNYETRRENATSLYRADDLLFGRACFVPATMIPWTHTIGASATLQRQARLTAQHFLFANGYNRDWYGFDYGSLIGSFDGVTWFSIGNQRRITATTNKLYLAVNAYFGDQTIDNTFTVNVTETSSSSTAIADHDSETDGAECQKSHFCSNDNDCIRSLGYDYTCQNVAGITTPWPSFDSNASELIDSTTKSLASILGGVNGQQRRCIYRGRGAPCVENLNNLSGNFNGSSIIGASACSANNYCQSLTDSNRTRFNNKIARFAASPANQNANPVNSTYAPSDLVGLGARIIGRPFEFYGKENPWPGASSTLRASNVNAVCIPGRNLASSGTTYDLNRLAPTQVDSSDKIIGAGVTASGLQSLNYYNACTATDNAGVMIQHYPLTLGTSAINQMTISQNLSTNLLNLAPLTSLGVFSTRNNSQTTSIGHQPNTCLRAPGASCFSDMDCGPSNFVATKAKTANLSTLLTPGEAKYWEEELVCGNPDFKYVDSGVLNASFDIKKNVCCRDTGNVLTTYTQMPNDPNSPQWCDNSSKAILVAGVNQSISAKRRYSKVNSGYDKMTCDPNQISSTRAFALSLEADNTSDRLRQILGQYKTLDVVNSRACCTNNWVRSFASDNGGGHAFARSKMQTVDKTMFKHVSWAPQNNTLGIVDEPFGCDPDNYTNSSCEVKSLTTSEQDKYLTWAGSLELLGIPQVAVMANDQVYKLVNDNQTAIAVGAPLDNSIMDYNVVGEDFNESGKRYYSAASYSKFDMTTLKKVFSENEFNCCIPSGKQVPTATTASQCCTGFIASAGTRRCCLPDYTDVTVYLNRYVSSEGRDLSESAYDPRTGYIKDPAQVLSLVSSKNLCCSGKAMVGVAISQLSIPLINNQYPLPATMVSTSKRFNYREDDVDNNQETGSVGSFFDAGVRWNNHVYCVPEGMGN